jgi:hypothetical protein
MMRLVQVWQKMKRKPEVLYFAELLNAHYGIIWWSHTGRPSPLPEANAQIALFCSQSRDLVPIDTIESPARKSYMLKGIIA